MMAANRPHKRKIYIVAVGLLIIYGSITTVVDLLHNHNDLTVRDDCPACVWLQMSQDSNPGASPAEQITSDLIVVALLPPPSEVCILHSCDASTHQQIRAPPTA